MESKTACINTHKPTKWWMFKTAKRWSTCHCGKTFTRGLKALLVIYWAAEAWFESNLHQKVSHAHGSTNIKIRRGSSAIKIRFTQRFASKRPDNKRNRHWPIKPSKQIWPVLAYQFLSAGICRLIMITAVTVKHYNRRMNCYYKMLSRMQKMYL